MPKGFRHFIKYSIVGSSNAFIDFSVYLGLTRSFLFFEIHYLLANACAFIISLTWGFIWNKNWSFKNKDTNRAKQYLKYFLVSMGGLAIIQAILYSLVTFGIYDLYAKVAGGLIAWAWNFSINKYWTFKKEF